MSTTTECTEAIHIDVRFEAKPVNRPSSRRRMVEPHSVSKLWAGTSVADGIPTSGERCLTAETSFADRLRRGATEAPTLVLAHRPISRELRRPRRSRTSARCSRSPSPRRPISCDELATRGPGLENPVPWPHLAGAASARDLMRRSVSDRARTRRPPIDREPGRQRVDRVRQRAVWAELRLQEPELRLSQQLGEARRGQHQGEVPAGALCARLERRGSATSRRPRTRRARSPAPTGSRTGAFASDGIRRRGSARERPRARLCRAIRYRSWFAGRASAPPATT